MNPLLIGLLDRTLTCDDIDNGLEAMRKIIS